MNPISTLTAVLQRPQRERRGIARCGLAALWTALLAALASLGSGARADEASVPPVAAAYRLSGYAPLGLDAPDPAHSESATAGGSEFFYRMPSAFTFDSLAGLDPDALGGPLDHARATLRYAWLVHPTWAMKVGLSTPLETDSAWQRLAYASTPRIGGLPAMHFSGQSQLSERWQLSLDAEGQRWSRGQSLDMDLRIDYHLSPGLALFGSYRLSDSFGETYEGVGFPVSNSARFGVRLRF